MSFPKELQKAGKSQKDFEEKRKAFENAGKASEENDIYLGLYEDLIDECKDYQELEEGYSNMARFLDQLGKKSFEFQQKARQARLLGFESEGINKVRIISAECCDSCSEYDGRVIELKKTLLTLPMPSSFCDAVPASVENTHRPHHKFYHGQDQQIRRSQPLRLTRARFQGPNTCP